MELAKLKRIVLIAGARPNFMKIAPIIDALKRRNHLGDELHYSLVHTGQHYDEKMSQEFFVQLDIPKPEVNLTAGGGTQAEQTANIMVRFEKHLIDNPADLVVVVGDVTSTLACSIVAKKLNVMVAHVEGGIRSHDMTMPEEINRLVTDSISDHFFTTSRLAGENLIREGKRVDQIHFVGNTMIDSLLKHRARFRQPIFWQTLGLKRRYYFVVTLHRPSNVDITAKLTALLEAITSGADGRPIIFPVHPRTRKSMDSLRETYPILKLVEPMGYLEFNYLVDNSLGVITDSGGVTEETTVLGTPCITLRDSTERPETVSVGTNELIGSSPARIATEMKRMREGQWKKGSIPELWDGHAAERIVQKLMEILGIENNSE